MKNGCVSFWPPAPPWEAQDPKRRCRPRMAPCGSPSSLPSMMNITAAHGEKVVHDLARLCGLDVPESKLETFSKTGSTFLVKRFDRNGSRRIHFASAMTLLGKTDGASAADGSSYLDLAAFIRANGGITPAGSGRAVEADRVQHGGIQY